MIISKDIGFGMSKNEKGHLRIGLSEKAIGLTAGPAGHRVGTLAHHQGGQDQEGQNLDHS